MVGVENLKALFLTRNPEANRDILLVCREFNLELRIVTPEESIRGDECDLIIADLNSLENTMVDKMTAQCGDVPYCLPIIYVVDESDILRLLDLIQKRAGSVITRPLNREIIYSLLNRMVHSADMKYRIREEHQYYDALMETANVTKTDPDGIITFTNENFCDLSGYSETELVGHSHSVVRHPDMPSEVFADLWSTIKQKKIWRGKVKNRKKNGDYFVVNAVIIPLLDEQGEIKEYMAIRNDITLLEQMHEQVLQEQSRKNEIIQSQKVLEEVNRTKDEFLVVFTHELKTPLNAIINFSEYISKQIEKSSIDKKERLLDLITSVRKNAVSMLENIINIIDLSKLKAGKLKLQAVLVDIGALMEDQLDRFSPIIEQNRIKVEMEIPKGCTIRSDEHRLGQLISNLLSNAIKYGDGRIKITAQCEKNKLVWSIEDNGPGIRDKEKVFELYEQETDNTVKRTAQGTGVGLHFVKYLCHHLNLSIEISDSRELGGAKIILRG